jgi:hypothetical protein
MEQPPNAAISEHVGVHSKKVIVGHEHEQGDSPDLSPMFVNNAEVLQVGTDFYLDFGIIRPDEIAQASTEIQQGTRTAPATLNFFVLQRIAMSERTFKMLMGRGAALLEGFEQLKKEQS